MIFAIPLSPQSNVWGRDVGSVGANGIEVRGSACWFPLMCDKVKGKSAEVRVVAEGGDKQSNSGSGDTTTPDLFGQDAGYSGEVGGPTAYFRHMCEGDRI